RQSVEVEAAGLAAARATPALLVEAGKALVRIDEAIERGENAVDEDFAFHRAIALATNNLQFWAFLDYRCRFIIPRQSIRVAAYKAEGQRPYLEMIQKEHRAIHDAILSGDPEAAREAMRRHLSNSQARYRRLAEEAAAARQD